MKLFNLAGQHLTPLVRNVYGNRPSLEYSKRTFLGRSAGRVVFLRRQEELKVPYLFVFVLDSSFDLCFDIVTVFKRERLKATARSVKEGTIRGSLLMII